MNFIVRAETPSYSTMTLVGAVQEALKRSPELAKARLDVEQAALSELLLLSELDPQLQSSYNYYDDQAPRAAPLFEGSRSRLETFDVALVQKTLLGTEAKLAWENDRLKNPSLFRTLDPSATSNLTLSLRQPLLRYFWGRPDVARRRHVRSKVLVLESVLKTKKTKTAMNAARAYLELYAAHRRCSINESAVEQAKRLVLKYTEKRRYGLIEESDLLQAKASLQMEETELDLARMDLTKARNALLTVLQRQNTFETETQSTSLPPPHVLPQIPEDLNAAFKIGMERRSDIGAGKALVQAAEWNVRTEKLDSLPDLSFLGSYGVAGLNKNYSGAWRDLQGFDHPVKSIGVHFSTPFGYKKEGLKKKAKKIELDSAQRDLDQVQQQAIQEIKDAWNNVKLQESRLKARRALLALQKEKLKAEEVNFGRGRSTTDVLVRFQQDINRAELEFLRTEIEELLARLELARAAGTLLDWFLNEEQHD